MVKKKIYKIGLLGGTFDPAHQGHIKISKIAKKKFNLKEVIWAITRKNPFKNKTEKTLKERILYAKKINVKNKFIRIIFLEDRLKSNRTIDIVKYLKKKNKRNQIYFIMGADNLINFHKWKDYEKISSKCNIVVFDRNKYKAKSLKSVSYKKYFNRGLKFINFKKINISSSQLRKNLIIKN